MYLDYLRERLGDESVVRDEGFATYRFLDDNCTPSVYIVDIYVRPDFRKTSIASEMADQIVEISKKMGCRRLIGTVVPNAKRSTESLKVLLGYGMELYYSKDNLVVFKKEL